MTELDGRIFARLFQDAYQKCFSRAFTSPLTEAESHHFSVEISESTGREIGWKSLKNYSQFLLDGSSGKRENPSNATLDTLARYVAGASVVEDQRHQMGQRGYPYWFRYEEAFRRADAPPTRATPAGDNRAAEPRTRRRSWAPWLFALLPVAVVLFIIIAKARTDDATFTDEFDDVSENALAERGWHVQSIDSAHWAQRRVEPGHLTLFTLVGDNWPQAGRVLGIKNLLVRRSPSACFVAELRLSAFFPRQNWQQAGLLLLEDTAFTKRSLRLSVGYNDFAGGFPAVREIVVQTISSLGQEFTKPEELAHQRVFALEPRDEATVAENLAHIALRIERHSHRFRLLYSVGPMENAAFKEVVTTDFQLAPAFVGVFALKGYMDESDDIRASVDRFSLRDMPCES